MREGALADDDAFSLYVRQFEESQQQGYSGRREAERARDYFDGRQFTASEIAELKKRRSRLRLRTSSSPRCRAFAGLSVRAASIR
jgi:hypothetical protein